MKKKQSKHKNLSPVYGIRKIQFKRIIMNLQEITKGKSPIEMFYHWEKTTPEKIFLRQPIDDFWYEYSWSKVGYQVRCLTNALYDLGLKKGDRISIISKNCAEWIIADLAMQLGGFVSVPLYFDQTEESCRYILEHSESKAIFVGKLDKPIWNRLRNCIPETMTKIGFSFYGDDGDCSKGSNVDYQIQNLIRDNEPYKACPVPKDEDWWTFIYTSGTTGNPKGAVQTYRAPRYFGERLPSLFDLGPDDRFLSFLPLAHVAERMMLATMSLYCNAQISFNQSLETFARDLDLVKPTAFFSVPRLWKKFQGGILENMPQKKLDLLLKIPILKNIIVRKIKSKLGFSKTRLFVSGAAPISPALLQWYSNIGIDIQEGYGMTENCGYGCFMQSKNIKPGTVGHPLPDCGFKISDEGEILFKSPALMACYFKDEANTSDAFTDDGYYRTGDIGEVDSDGFVRIAGRIKESFKTEKGEFVSPAPIEAKLASLDDLEQICLAGTGLAQPVAVVTLSEVAQIKPRSEIESLVLEHVSDLNKSLLNHEKIGGVVISSSDWTPETDMVTPTLKIRRNKVEDRYEELMGRVTTSSESLLWEGS